MSAPVGRREFFALEAGEYLERLALLAAATPAPAPADLVRYARALRGAALMAGPPGFAVTASALEGVAKALQEQRRPWDGRLAGAFAEVVEECKALLRRLATWSDVDRARCEALADGLDALAGGAGSRPAGPPGGAGVSAGVRAFVAREAAGVAATLDQVADALERAPAPGVAAALGQRMQPLRGMGALPGLTPLPDLLDVLDLVLGTHARSGSWPPATARAFRAAGAAMARMARDIADVGVPQTDSREVVHATELLREAFASEDDVVPVDTLAPPGLDPIVSRGAPPPLPTVPVDPGVELTGLADRLRHAAAPGGPEAARSTRTLALFSLAMALRGLPMSPPVRSATGDFFRRLDRESMAGRSAPDVLRRAADLMSAAAHGGPVAALGPLLAPLGEELDRLAGIPAVLAPPAEPGIIPIEDLAPDADVVPIESLLLPPLLPFEQSFSSLFELARGTPTTAEELAPVPIGNLLYRGRRALERANLVRRELDAALKVRRDLSSIESLLAELLDLVPLALDEAR